MIEIKNTKVRLYTVEGYRKKVDVTHIKEDIYSTLLRAEGKKIVILDQLAKRTITDECYYGAFRIDNSYDVIKFDASMIKEVITDEPKMKYKVGDRVLMKSKQQLIDEGMYPLSPLSDNQRAVTDEIAGTEVMIQDIDGLYYAGHPDKIGVVLQFPEEYIERLVEPDKYSADILLKEYNPESVSIGLIAELKSEKPSLGITPRKYYEEMANAARINDLWDAMDRYVKEGCKILPEWIDELKERYKMVEES